MDTERYTEIRTNKHNMIRSGWMLQPVQRSTGRDAGIQTCPNCTVSIMMLLRNARHPSVWTTFALASENNMPYPDTAHQRDCYRQWNLSVSEIPDFETFQSFWHENLLGTGARTVRGWKDIRKLASTRSD